MGKKNKKNLICEILAPAGSFSCMKAAFQAGADAVYAGGELFGARASAVNFSNEELLEAIDYAHIRGKKIYLTVNTLMKEREIPRLREYLKPFYEAGLDAVIVQDMGVLEIVRREFPEIAVHASTQMSVTGPYFGKELKRLGATRIVTARELSLEEIKKIHEETELEIESFVHGALCYCYSGQCLLSSMIGGRSGNRGRCAQPCRLEYAVNGKKDRQASYPLSPKDLCTLHLIPEMLDAGIYSFKIEGRMKKPEYVASVTAMYRKYVDLYLEKGREGFFVEEEDVRLLQEIYNRGGFTDGYYQRHNGKEMMSLKKPGHQGVKIGEVGRMTKDQIEIKTVLDLEKGDVLEFDLKKGNPNYTCGAKISAGDTFFIKNKFQDGMYLTGELLVTREVRRIRHQVWIDEITKCYLDTESKIKVRGTASFYEGCPAELELTLGDTVVLCQGSLVEQAQKQPLDRQGIEQKLKKTGDTPFEFEALEIFCGEDIFLPVKELNALRREAFEKLQEKVCQKYHRVLSEHEQECELVSEGIQTGNRMVEVLVSSEEQFAEALQRAYVDRIIFEEALFSGKQLEAMIAQGKQAGKEVYLALPYILRNPEKLFLSEEADGYLYRTLEEYFYCQQKKEKTDRKKILFDSMIYAYNKEAGAYFKKMGAELTASRELNSTELKELKGVVHTIEVYGCVPVMVSANCVKKNYEGCSGTQGFMELTDRRGEKLKALSVCRHCYNVIYQENPVCLFEECKELQESKRLSFVYESGTETGQILDDFWHCSRGEMGQRHYGNTGHYRRGVL